MAPNLHSNMVRFIIYIYLIYLLNFYNIYIPIWLDLLSSNLWSLLDKIIGFTFQYG